MGGGAAVTAPNATLAKMLGQDGNIIVPKAFADIMGGLDGGAVLTDLAYWQATHGDWFWRTDALIAARQHVTPYAAKHARGKLIAARLLELRMQGQPAKAHYRLDLDAIMDLAGADPVQPLRARPPESDGSGPPESKGASGGEIGGAIPYSSSEGSIESTSGVSVAPAATGESAVPTAAPDDAWLPLKVSIATLATGKPRTMTAAGKPLGWIGTIVGDVGKIAGDDPDLALTLWDCFEEALTPDERERFINSGNVGERFGRWSKNGGASTIRAILAQGDGGEA